MSESAEDIMAKIRELQRQAIAIKETASKQIAAIMEGTADTLDAIDAEQDRVRSQAGQA